MRSAIIKLRLMATLRDTPYRTVRFLVDLVTGENHPFFEVTLPDHIVEPIEYRDGNDRTPGAHKVPGPVGVTNLILKRYFRGSLELYAWVRQLQDDPSQGRRNITVQLLSENGVDVVAAWHLRNAWPTRHSFSPLNAVYCDVLIEEIEIVCESVELE